MEVVSRIVTLQKALAAVRGKGRIGLVPTMGAFHAGHCALMRQARRECDFVVVSLFINPTQFGPQEDYAAYPRHLASDRKQAQATGVDLLWTPTVAAMYPPDNQTHVDVGPIARQWEGESRPGHFEGVATIVAKLFCIVRPNRAYFGRKDYQQTCVIRQMTRDLHLGVALRILPTVREADGLALSSRNERLSPAERQAAPTLYQALMMARQAAQCGERRAKALCAHVRRHIQSSPLFHIDYIALCHPDTLDALGRLERTAVLLVAARIGAVRLIDNQILSAS